MLRLGLVGVVVARGTFAYNGFNLLRLRKRAPPATPLPKTAAALRANLKVAPMVYYAKQSKRRPFVYSVPKPLLKVVVAVYFVPVPRLIFARHGRSNALFLYSVVAPALGRVRGFRKVVVLFCRRMKAAAYKRLVAVPLPVNRRVRLRLFFRRVVVLAV